MNLDNVDDEVFKAKVEAVGVSGSGLGGESINKHHDTYEENNVFALPFVPTDILDITINGVSNETEDDYILDGNTVTINRDMVDGDNIIIYYKIGFGSSDEELSSFADVKLINVDNEDFKAKAEEAGVGGGDDSNKADKDLSNVLDDDVQKKILLSPHISTEMDDTQIFQGTFINAGAGWNTFKFPPASNGVQVIFDGVPSVVCTLEDCDGTVQIINVTEEGFQYQVKKLSNGSVTTGTYYTAQGNPSTASTSAHVANTLVSAVTVPSHLTTADPVKIHYVATYRNI